MICTESYDHIIVTQLGKPSELICLQLTRQLRDDQCFFPLHGVRFWHFPKIFRQIPCAPANHSSQMHRNFHTRCIPRAAHGCLWVKFYLFWFLVKTITDIFYWSLTAVLKHFSPAQHCKTFPNLSNIIIIIIIALLISSKRLFSLIYNVKYLNI